MVKRAPRITLKPYNFKRRYPEWKDPPEVCTSCNEALVYRSLDVHPQGYWPVKYMCMNCGASVGTHPYSVYPLGTMADPALRKKRMSVHHCIDYLWKDCGWIRNDVYRLMANLTGIRDFHVGELSMVECEHAIRAFRRWEARADFSDHPV